MRAQPRDMLRAPVRVADLPARLDDERHDDPSSFAADLALLGPPASLNDLPAENGTAAQESGMGGGGGVTNTRLGAQLNATVSSATLEQS